ncbi:MAG: hypothetical protein OEV91_02735 [Desulfobulbaceae bacterium]|nr:hypothetical protein [Desulfobulbaceae bacterium]
MKRYSIYHTLEIDDRIEPLPFNVDDFIDDNPLGREIKPRGLVVRWGNPIWNRQPAASGQRRERSSSKRPAGEQNGIHLRPTPGKT